MVPMETFCPASKEPSLALTLDSLPAFQLLSLSLSSGRPSLFPGTTVGSPPQSHPSLSPTLHSRPAWVANPRFPALPLPSPSAAVQVRGQSAPATPSPFPSFSLTVYLKSQPTNESSALPLQYPSHPFLCLSAGLPIPHLVHLASPAKCLQPLQGTATCGGKWLRAEVGSTPWLYPS